MTPAWELSKYELASPHGFVTVTRLGAEWMAHRTFMVAPAERGDCRTVRIGRLFATAELAMAACEAHLAELDDARAAQTAETAEVRP